MVSSRIGHKRPMRSGNNSTLGEKIAERIHASIARVFGGRLIAGVVALFGILIGVLSTLFWFSQVYADPSHVFWSAVNDNLSTYSVTKDAKQNDQGGPTESLTQMIFNPTVVVKNIKTVTNTTPQGEGRVKVESISTPKDTYQHYLLIDQPGAQKKDYSKVYPLWLLNGGNTQVRDTEIFNNSLFGAFLFGDIAGQDKNSIVDALRSAYSVNFDNTKKERIDGRKLYTYEVKISLKKYAKAAQLYAKALGLPNASQINPNSYQDDSILNVKVSIDVLSRQLRQLTYQSNSSTEYYSGYGIHTTAEAPNHTISYQTLQKTIQEASK